MDRFIQSLPYLSNITDRNAIMLKNVSQTKKMIQEIIFKLMLSIKSLHWQTFNLKLISSRMLQFLSNCRQVTVIVVGVEFITQDLRLDNFRMFWVKLNSCTYPFWFSSLFLPPRTRAHVRCLRARRANVRKMRITILDYCFLYLFSFIIVPINNTSYYTTSSQRTSMIRHQRDYYLGS